MLDYEIRIFRDGHLSLIAFTSAATDAGALFSIGKIRDSSSRIEMWRGLEQIAVPGAEPELHAAQ